MISPEAATDFSSKKSRQKNLSLMRWSSTSQPVQNHFRVAHRLIPDPMG